MGKRRALKNCDSRVWANCGSAVLQSERGKRLEGEAKISNVKAQSPNGAISGRAEKRALSANQRFFRRVFRTEEQEQAPFTMKRASECPKKDF